MAYHQLMSESEFDSNNPTVIVPTRKSQSTYTVPNNTWVTDCEEFSGASLVYTVDSDTLIFLYLKQFIYKGYCFFGLLPTVLFREGRVSNAWLGVGLFGSYQNDYGTASMDGDAFVFSLQAQNASEQLHNVYVREGTLNQTVFRLENHGETSMKCQDVATDPSTDYQIRQWYCVRPRTTDFPSGEFDVSKYVYNETDSIPFGYAFAYGEGRWTYQTMHSSRGTCGMYFNDNDSSDNDIFDFSNNSDSRLELVACYQEGVEIGPDVQGQSIGVFKSAVDIAYNVSNEYFMEKSNYSEGDIPGNDDISSTTAVGGTTSTSVFTTTSEDSDDGVVLRVDCIVVMGVAIVFSSLGCVFM